MGEWKARFHFLSFFDSINQLCSIWSDFQHMKPGSSQIRSTEGTRQGTGDRRAAEAACRGTGDPAKTQGDATMECEAISGRMDAVAARPLADLLECPPATGNLLNGSAQCIDFDGGEIVFRQSGTCRGLYLVVSGLFQRRTERLETRLTLGPARAGDLVELSAALGDGHHTYTLSAQTPGSMLLLPMEALNQAFQSYPPLRMRLLEELAREVSRAYNTCRLNRTLRVRPHGSSATPA
jgi:hypothetical protein